MLSDCRVVRHKIPGSARHRRMAKVAAHEIAARRRTTQNQSYWTGATDYEYWYCYLSIKDNFFDNFVNVTYRHWYILLRRKMCISIVANETILSLLTPMGKGHKVYVYANITLKQLFSVDIAPTPTEEICKHFNELRSDLALALDLKNALTACEFDLQALRHQYEALNPGKVKIFSIVFFLYDMGSLFWS